MRYLDLLADQVHLVMLHFYPDGDGYIMDDNASMHRARSVHKVEKRIRHHSPLPSNLQDLKSCIANK